MHDKSRLFINMSSRYLQLILLSWILSGISNQNKFDDTYNKLYLIFSIQDFLQITLKIVFHNLK